MWLCERRFGVGAGVGGIDEPRDPCSARTRLRFAARRSGETEKAWNCRRKYIQLKYHTSQKVTKMIGTFELRVVTYKVMLSASVVRVRTCEVMFGTWKAGLLFAQFFIFLTTVVTGVNGWWLAKILIQIWLSQRNKSNKRRSLHSPNHWIVGERIASRMIRTN